MERGYDLILIGAHGAGKTTLGELVSARLGVRFDDELGRRMRGEALEEDATQDAAASQPGFDERLWARELARDAQARGVARAGRPRRVVETWHIGNAAYAAMRAPGESARWRGRLHSALLGHDVPVVVQPLAVPPGEFLARFSEPGERDEQVRRFLRKVGWQLRRAALDSPVHTLPTLWTHDRSPAQCCDQLIERLSVLSHVMAGA
jgi:hypothetical protein